MAQLIDGKFVAKKVKNDLAEQVALLKKSNADVVPGLAIVQVGDRKDSNVYIKSKLKSADEIGMRTWHVKLPRSTNEVTLLKEIERLNADDNVHGIIVQLPLDTTEDIDDDAATNAVAPEKDVDGLHALNAGKLARGDLSDCFIPCTPRGSFELIRHCEFEVKGAEAVVVGRSKIVGSPMADLLKWNHATVTTCHTRTKDMAEVVSRADLVVVAAGKSGLVKGNWIKPGAVVIDCGINVIPDASKKSGQRLVGDVEFDSAKQRASWITPVPGGVGPMTVAMLLANTVDSARRSAIKVRPIRAGCVIQ